MSDPSCPDRPAGEVTAHEVARRGYVVAPVAPLDVDGTRTVAVGSLLFLAAFVLLLPFHDRLEAAGKGWWQWTCLAGFGLGLVGWAYCRRRRNRRQAREGVGPGSSTAR